MKAAKQALEDAKRLGLSGGFSVGLTETALGPKYWLPNKTLKGKNQPSHRPDGPTLSDLFA